MEHSLLPWLHQFDYFTCMYLLKRIRAETIVLLPDYSIGRLFNILTMINSFKCKISSNFSIISFGRRCCPKRQNNKGQCKLRYIKDKPLIYWSKHLWVLDCGLEKGIWRCYFKLLNLVISRLVCIANNKLQLYVDLCL